MSLLTVVFILSSIWLVMHWSRVSYLRLLPEIWASAARIRLKISDEVISREKTHTAGALLSLCFLTSCAATFMQILIPRVVLPTLGRAAMIISCPGAMPKVLVSSRL